MSNRVSFDLSAVPEEWSVILCGVFFKEKSVKNTEGEMNLSVYRDYGVIPKDSRDDNHNRVSEDTSNYKLVEPGDFVLNKMKGWSGSLGVSDYRGIVSPSYTVLEPVKEIHKKYFHYLLRSEAYRQMYESLSYGVRIRQWELRYHDFKQIPSLYPPIEEQKLISHYLDKKTSQIDSLVEKIQKKIELLEEQRTSLINHYVNKGLSPNVEMKDSGIEWIGDIPKHWELKRLATLGSFSKGKNITKNDLTESGHPVILYGHLYTTYSRITNHTNFFVSYEKSIKTTKITRGTFLFTSSGESVEEIGKTLLYNGKEEINVGGDMVIFKLKDSDSMCLEFLSHSLNSNNCQHQKSSVSRGEIVVHVYEKQLREVSIPVPPLSEQIQITKKLNHIEEHTLDLISALHKKIETLKEYRQSLISSVVTGKIRVTEDII